MSKVSVALMGGLGNRMFQVAFIYAYGKKYNKNFGIGRNDPNAHSERNYESLVYPFLKPIALNPDHYIFQESHALTFLSLPNSDKDVEFIGYFQCPSYFEEYRSDLLGLFQFPELPFQIIEECCFVHVRRGDYIQGINVQYHLLPLESYYLKAIETIRSKVPHVHFYILSEDKEYCENLFKDVEKKTIISDKEANELETMALMKRCKYGGICSNSSFSWWGAYLNESKNKICILPNMWFPRSSPMFRENYDIHFKGCFIMDIETLKIFIKV